MNDKMKMEMEEDFEDYLSQREAMEEFDLECPFEVYYLQVRGCRLEDALDAIKCEYDDDTVESIYKYFGRIPYIPIEQVLWYLDENDISHGWHKLESKERLNLGSLRVAMFDIEPR